jgi:hypothetical protein
VAQPENQRESEIHGREVGPENEVFREFFGGHE